MEAWQFLFYAFGHQIQLALSKRALITSWAGQHTQKIDFHFGIVKYNINKQAWAQRALPVLPQTQAPGVPAPGGLASYLAPGLVGGAGGTPPLARVPLSLHSTAHKFQGVSPARGGGSFPSECCSFKWWGSRMG